MLSIMTKAKVEVPELVGIPLNYPVIGFKLIPTGSIPPDTYH